VASRADQHSPENEGDEQETEEEDHEEQNHEKEDDEEEDDGEEDEEDPDEEDPDDEDQDDQDDGEIVDDKENEDGGVLGRPDSPAARQLLSEAQSQSNAAVSAPGYEAHSQNAPKGPGMCTPTDLEPDSDDLGSAEGAMSPQVPAHERTNREEHGKRAESTDPIQHPFVSFPERGAPSDLVPPTQMAPMALPAAHDPVPENMEQDGMVGVVSERQFFVDFHLGCEEILAESRATKLPRTGGPAGKGLLPPSEIAHRALSLSMEFQSHEAPGQLKGPFWSGRTLVSPSTSAALADKRSEQQAQALPLPSPTSLPPPPAVVYHQLEQRSAPLRAATSPQIPIPPPAAFVQSRNMNQVQTPDPNQPHHGLSPLPAIDPHRGQHESFPSNHYSPDPLPIATPHLPFPAPQQTGGLPPFSQLVHTLFNPVGLL